VLGMALDERINIGPTLKCRAKDVFRETTNVSRDIVTLRQKVRRTSAALCRPISAWNSICRASSRDLRLVPIEQLSAIGRQPSVYKKQAARGL